MKKAALILIVGSVVILSACIKLQHGGPPTLMMGGSNFVGTTNFTLKVGQSLTFDDPMGSGGTHILSTGENGTYEAENGAPDALNVANGVTFNAGDKQMYTFNTAGTYHITCQIHQIMNATVVVSS